MGDNDSSCHLQSLSQRPTLAMCEPLKGMRDVQLSVAVIQGVISWCLSRCSYVSVYNLCKNLVLKHQGFVKCCTLWRHHVNRLFLTPDGSEAFSWHPKIYDVRREKGTSVDGAQQQKDFNDIQTCSLLSKSKVFVFWFSSPYLCFRLVLLTWIQQSLSQSEVLCQEGWAATRQPGMSSTDLFAELFFFIFFQLCDAFWGWASFMYSSIWLTSNSSMRKLITQSMLPNSCPELSAM